ncbi:MAG: universal stress protein [Ignavibacteriaceae bacterium]
MEAPFKKLALAVTFSPTSRALLKEAARLRELFDAELLLIHVGEKSPDIESRMSEMLHTAGLTIPSVKLDWGTGEPSHVISEKCISHKIDLLIAGALEKEGLITYYTGSIARKLMRNPPCSLLVLVSPKEAVISYNKICVSVTFGPECPATIKKTFRFAQLENTKEITLIREFQVPGLSITVYDGAGSDETEDNRNRWVREEEGKMRIFLSEHNLISSTKLDLVALYGKAGWEAKNFAEKINADLFVIPAPHRKLKLFDRLFQNDTEFIFESLPCSLLMIKN